MAEKERVARVTEIIAGSPKSFDEEVVVDGNLITSRNPDDLPAFMKAVIQYLEAR